MVSSRASVGYEHTLPDGSLRPESYVFMEGDRLGATRDKSLAPTEFQGLLESLAPALAKREYWPATVATEADLLIVVHWGETEVYEDPVRDIEMEALNGALNTFNTTISDFGIADPGRINELMASQGLSQRFVADSARRNAELLGYKEAIMRAEQEFIPSVDEITMKSELGEPRYFVVLSAWDYTAIRRGERPRLLWVSRMNTRSAGLNFRLARELLIAQAAPKFGEQVDGLVRVRVKTGFGHGEVEIGETKVVEEVAPQ
ncbi:hypothetical protein [Actomonas aquatica]|uniref:Uncharacterized protein n=1 Tax=Actomonas aquatica TaxID=2866162 RepID=A0ABZ1C7I6_9BACT|nr:hypothetical protein [Opitutus sp. WL0086]WRQ87292.1 hypothetical protein K1X11_020965 [Opitutus sp. WL0086]